VGVIYNKLLKKVPRKTLGVPVLVNIQNVVDYVMAADEYAVKEKEMNLSPPWDYALFEWDVESPLLMSENNGEYFTHHGMLIDFFRQEEGGWTFSASLYFASKSSDIIYEYFRYDGEIDEFGKPGNMYSENGVSFQNNEAVINVSTGEAIDLRTKETVGDRVEERWNEDLPAIRYSYLRMVFVALTFANCHNVVICDTVPELTRQMRRQMERIGEPVVVYKTLVIPGTTVQYEGTRTSNGTLNVARRMHLCRGHFAHHENLFGRLGPRTVWVPLHVKGNADTGVVIKDYRVGV